MLRTERDRLRRRRRRREPGEQRVERARIEAEIGDRRIGRPLGAEVRLNRDVRILVLEVHRQLELLRDVVRVELERPLRLAQRPLEVAEVREREAHVVVRLGEVRARLDRARERVPRVLELAQLRQHEADAVPRDRMLRVASSTPGGYASSASGSRFRRVSSSARLSRAFDEVGRPSSAVRNAVERLVDRAAVIERHAEVVLRDARTPARRPTRAGSSSPPRRSGRPGAARRRARSRASGSSAARRAARRTARSASAVLPHEQVHLGHRLQHEVALLAALERDLVLAQRLGVVALAAEREAEVVVRELAFAAHLQLAFRRAASASGRRDALRDRSRGSPARATARD